MTNPRPCTRGQVAFPDLFFLFSIRSTNETHGLCSFPHTLCFFSLFSLSPVFIYSENCRRRTQLVTLSLFFSCQILHPTARRIKMHSCLSLSKILHGYSLLCVRCWTSHTWYHLMFVRQVLLDEEQEPSRGRVPGPRWGGRRGRAPVITSPPKSYKTISNTSFHAPPLWYPPHLQSISFRSLFVPHGSPVRLTGRLCDPHRAGEEAEPRDDVACRKPPADGACMTHTQSV